MNYYVYYRVQREQATALRTIVDAVISDVFDQTSVLGRLMQSEDAMTWMEVYEGVTDRAAFECALVSALDRTGFHSVAGPGALRQTERFIEAR